VSISGSRAIGPDNGSPAAAAARRAGQRPVAPRFSGGPRWP